MIHITENGAYNLNEDNFAVLSKLDIPGEGIACVLGLKGFQNFIKISEDEFDSIKDELVNQKIEANCAKKK